MSTSPPESGPITFIQQITCMVTLKHRYGVDDWHPACDNARLLADIAGTKTLTWTTIERAKKMGIKFIDVTPKPTI